MDNALEPYLARIVRGHTLDELYRAYRAAQAEVPGGDLTPLTVAGAARRAALADRTESQLALLESEFGGVWIQGGTGAHRAMQAARRGEQ